MDPFTVAFVLPGLGRVHRGAETAFLELARSMALHQGATVHLFGSGKDWPEGCHGHTIPCIRRENFEKWPKIPVMRSDCVYEEATFAWNLWRHADWKPSQYDCVISCSYPFVNWLLNSLSRSSRPIRIFSTQNGDWACSSGSSEFRFFGTDGVVCINPEYYERNKNKYPCALVPNGVDPEVFHPPESPMERDPRIPADQPLIFMASAMIPSKGVDHAIRGVARAGKGFLVVAGDGPERSNIARLAASELPGRHLLLGSIPRTQMPLWFRQADLFLHASREEPFGIVYLEAAASGLPIVAPDEKIPRWILGDLAAFCAPENPESMGQALIGALSRDKQVWGASLRQRVLEGWTWKVQAQKYRDLYETIARERRTRTSHHGR